MDEDMQAFEVRDYEIERRLDAYARARLSPDPQAIARARARVMREARLQFEAGTGIQQLAPVIVLAPRRVTVRRVAMPILAASVWLGVAVGSIAASSAGGPLYPARIWVENATLPSTGTARADAEIARLGDRLAEAQAAAARGDAGAVEAALDAYHDIADQAIAGSSADPELEALVAAALDRHQVVLSAIATSLVEKDNDTAAAAVEASIEREIAHNQAVVDRLDADRGNAGGSGSGSNGAGDGNGSTGGGGSTGAGSNDGSGGATGAGNGDNGGNGGTVGSGGDKPQPTPKPTPSPRPTPVPTDPTDPHGQPSHAPHGTSN
jgi:hypothetical protein